MCREVVTGHGLRDTCSVTAYKAWVGGRASTVNECVSLCMFFQRRYVFLSELEAFLYRTVLLMLPIFTEMFGGERLISTCFLA